MKRTGFLRSDFYASEDQKTVDVTPNSLLLNNRMWAEEIANNDPTFFRRLEKQQAPDYFWIGCSDSRVPASQIVDMLPGEIFVHRNVANLVVHSDLSCLSAMQFAVDVLKVKHIIVCGHYECSGIIAAIRDERYGLVDNWLRHIQDLSNHYSYILGIQKTEKEKAAVLSKLNVIHQVTNVADTTVVRDAWSRGQDLTIHGWIYGVGDGLLRDLDVVINPQSNSQLILKRAINRIQVSSGIEATRQL